MEPVDENKSISKAAIDSLASDKTIKVLSELGELVLEDEVREDIFDQLLILRYRGVYKSLKDAFFFNKFCKFLEGLAHKSIDERAAYISKLSEEEIIVNGKYLVNYIDRLDDEAKPEIAGKIFSEYVVGNIERKEMLRFNHILDKIFILDLLELKHSVEKKFIEDDLALRLAPLGITEYGVRNNPELDEYLGRISGNRPVRNPGHSMQPKLTTSVSYIGNKFIEVAFDVQQSNL